MIKKQNIKINNERPEHTDSCRCPRYNSSWCHRLPERFLDRGVYRESFPEFFPIVRSNLLIFCSITPDRRRGLTPVSLAVDKCCRFLERSFRVEGI